MKNFDRMPYPKVKCIDPDAKEKKLQSSRTISAQEIGI